MGPPESGPDHFKYGLRLKARPAVSTLYNLSVSSTTKDWRESPEEVAASPEAIAAVDALFTSIGLEHGRRATRAGTWQGGERVRQPRTSTVTPRSSTRKPRRAPGLIRPAGWEAYPWLRAGFSTREGGATTAFGNPGDLNLGWNVNDPAETVAANRKHFVEAVSGSRRPANSSPSASSTARSSGSSVPKRRSSGHRTPHHPRRPPRPSR